MKQIGRFINLLTNYLYFKQKRNAELYIQWLFVVDDSWINTTNHGSIHSFIEAFVSYFLIDPYRWVLFSDSKLCEGRDGGVYGFIEHHRFSSLTLIGVNLS